MYFVQWLKKFNLPKSMVVHFCTTPTSSITIWYAVATAKYKGRLQCIVRSAEVSAVDTSKYLMWAEKIVADHYHPRHKEALKAAIWQGAAVHQDQTEQLFPCLASLIKQAQDPHWNRLLFRPMDTILYTYFEPKFLLMWITW